MESNDTKIMSRADIEDFIETHDWGTEPKKITNGYTWGNAKILINRSNVVFGSDSDKKNLAQVGKQISVGLSVGEFTVTRI